jgi:hypothetical protein
VILSTLKSASVRRVTIAILVLLVPAVVGFLGFLIWLGSAQGELESELARISEAGEPVWFRDLATEPVDATEDGTQLYLLAASQIRPASMTFQNYLFPGVYPEFVAELATNRHALDLLGQAVRRRHFRTPIDFETDHPLSATLPYAQDARNCARLLEGDVLYAIGSGDERRAIAALQELFGLCELFREDPFEITHMVRFSIGSVSIHALETTVGYVELLPEEFTALDDQLARMEQEANLKRVVWSERAARLTDMEHATRESLAEYLASMRSDVAVPRRPWGSFWNKPLLMRDQVNMLRKMSLAADVIDEPGAYPSRQLEELDDAIEQNGTRFPLSRIMKPWLQQMRESSFRHRQRLATARLGLRVNRYFAANGKFPESLGDVLDDRLNKLPSDLLSGKPLVYRVLADGFVIYPVGMNGIDDGGGLTPDNWENFCNFEVHYLRLMQPEEALPNK